jgi:hypothetical protein
LAADEPKS